MGYTAGYCFDNTAEDLWETCRTYPQDIAFKNYLQCLPTVGEGLLPGGHLHPSVLHLSVFDLRLTDGSWVESWRGWLKGAIAGPKTVKAKGLVQEHSCFLAITNTRVHFFPPQLWLLVWGIKYQVSICLRINTSY